MGKNRRASQSESNTSTPRVKSRRPSCPSLSNTAYEGKVGINNGNSDHLRQTKTVIVSTGVQTDIPYYNLQNQNKKIGVTKKLVCDEENHLLESYRSYKTKENRRDHYLKLLNKC